MNQNLACKVEGLIMEYNNISSSKENISECGASGSSALHQTLTNSFRSQSRTEHFIIIQHHSLSLSEEIFRA